jgi:hypothetical protein
MIHYILFIPFKQLILLTLLLSTSQKGEVRNALSPILSKNYQSWSVFSDISKGELMHHVPAHLSFLR